MAASAASVRRASAGATTPMPCACSSAITAPQPEASAKAPCTSTTVGVLPLMNEVRRMGATRPYARGTGGGLSQTTQAAAEAIVAWSASRSSERDVIPSFGYTRYRCEPTVRCDR